MFERIFPIVCDLLSGGPLIGANSSRDITAEPLLGNALRTGEVAVVCSEIFARFLGSRPRTPLEVTVFKVFNGWVALYG